MKRSDGKIAGGMSLPSMIIVSLETGEGILPRNVQWKDFESRSRFTNAAGAGVLKKIGFFGQNTV